MSKARPISSRLKPKSGFSHFLHIGITILLPTLLFILVRIGFVQLGLALILLSKWRIFAVKPRHWPALILANAVDIMVGLSALVFMANSGSQMWELIWALAYAIWLLIIKPGSNVLKVSMQAWIGQLAALSALFLSLSDAPVVPLVIAAWFICYTSARHFFNSFDESYSSLLSYTWGYFGAALTWVLSHWLLFYGGIAQPTVLISVLASGLAALYYLESSDRLSALLRRQFIFVMVAVVFIVIAFSDWGDKTI